MVKIVVDCFGGDKSPEANVKGAVEALNDNNDIFLVLTGDEDKIVPLLEKEKYDKDRLSVVDAKEVISPNEKPTDAIRLKKDSSLMVGITMLRKDEADALVSTGSSGAIVASGTLRVGRLYGVKRPCFCPVLPTMNGGIVGICDSGANVECTVEEMTQFAIMGSMYIETVFGDRIPNEKARVGLLNVGAEAEKGDELHRNSYEAIKKLKDLDFKGNMEGRELLGGNYDLCVCDGFSGNVLVKSTEGAGLGLLKKLKKDLTSSFKNKIGALILKKMFMEEKEFMDYQNYGGSVLLGTKKVIVKGHGSSNAHAVAVCIDQSYKMVNGRLPERMEEALKVTYEEKEEELCLKN